MTVPVMVMRVPGFGVLPEKVKLMAAVQQVPSNTRME